MLKDADILRAWELCEGKTLVEQALVVLGCVHPESSWAELLRLSIGQRDALLLRARSETFGQPLRGFAECEQCGETQVFSTPSQALLVGGPAPGSMSVSSAESHPESSPESPSKSTAPQQPPDPQEIEFADWVLRVRPLNSADLLAASVYGDLEMAKEELLSRCLISASQNGISVAASELPPDVYQALLRALAEQDPQAEVLLCMRCTSPACQHQWAVLFDIASYFLTEIAAQAKRLLREVDALARAYGWRESDILSLSTVRRRHYLEIVGA